MHGEDVTGTPHKMKEVLGLVPQDISLYPYVDGSRKSLFGEDVLPVGAVLKERVEEIWNTPDSRNGNDRIDTYSGGMKRRINIAAALLHKPEFLIMDEPTVGIDPQSRNHILETVLRLNEEGVTVLYTSHYMEEVEHLCSRIAIMDHGKIIAEGTLEELRNTVGDADSVELVLSDAPDSLAEEIGNHPGVLRAKKVTAQSGARKERSRESGGHPRSGVSLRGQGPIDQHRRTQP